MSALTDAAEIARQRLDTFEALNGVKPTEAHVIAEHNHYLVRYADAKDAARIEEQKRQATFTP